MKKMEDIEIARSAQLYEITQIANAGIKEVIIRDDKEHYRVLDVQDFIDNDESLEGKIGY